MRPHRRALPAVMAAYLVAALLYAFLTPPWQTPDEPAHYNYARHLAETARLPVLQPGDYPGDYLARVVDGGFPDDMPIDPLRYEGHQPPLYYAAASAVLAPLLGLPPAAQVRALRLLSVALGLAVLALTYRLGLALWPANAGRAAALAAVSLLIPMHTAVSAAANNDILAEALVIAVVLGALRLPGRAGAAAALPARAGRLGLLAGLCLLTKMTALVAVPLAALGLLLAWRQRRPSGHVVVRSAVAFALPVLLMGGLWVGRNLATYGPADPLGQARHDAVVLGQPTTAARLAELGPAALLSDGLWTSFRSFWGVFGWMAVPMHEQVYLALALGSLLALAGAALWAWQRRRRPVPPERLALYLLLAAWGALSVAGFVWYNLKFVQYQGRYVFAAAPVWAAILVQGTLVARERAGAFAAALAAAGIVVYLVGFAVAEPQKWPAALALAGGAALLAWSRLGRRWPVPAGAAAVAPLWALSLAGALYYVSRYL